MQARISLVLAMLCVATTGCHSYQYRLPVPPAPPPSTLPPPAPAVGGGICDIDPSACPKASEVHPERVVHAEVYAVQQIANDASFMSAPTPTTPPAAPASPLPEAAVQGAPHEMLDVEARFSIQCEDVTATSVRLRTTVRAGGGTITLDESSSGGRDAEATFEVRVPLRDLDTLVEHLGKLGTIDAREVKAKDVGKEFHDAKLLLHNLEVASNRYEQLLARASAVQDVLTVEHELERLRAQIDRVKGELAWMTDRVARATVRIRLHPSPTSTAEEPPLASKSSFFPGVRAVSLFDLRSESDRYGYLGGGLAFTYHGAPEGPRALVFELDIARTALTDRPPDSNYAYLGLVGVDVYSDLFGGGRRRFFNPYLGFRGGYAQSQGRGDVALGGLLGVDVFKSRATIVELSFRALALFGSDRGLHVAVGPTLGFDFAF